jgi:hypothetical protein
VSKKNRVPAGPPPVPADLMTMPGTRLNFWAVGECPYCSQRHYHLAGGPLADPRERLGEVSAPCGEGQYVLTLPVRKARKGKKGARRERWDDWNPADDDE